MTVTQAGPWRITFDTNPDDCNLKCIMCEQFSPFSPAQKQRQLPITKGREPFKPRRMDVKLIRKVLEEARDSPLREIIPSTMGEPLLYEHFEEILALCQEYSVKLNLTTNGTFPRKGAEAWAKLITPVTSDVKISWNGSTAETAQSIMLGTNFKRVLENVVTFIKVRDEVAASGLNHCRVTFQLTFLESNYLELPDIVKLAAQLGVERVKGHHLWAHFEEIKPLSMRRNLQAIERWNKIVLKTQEAAEQYRLASGKQVLLENIFQLDTNLAAGLAAHTVCPFLGQEAWIDTTGRFGPCCAPDKERRTLGDFGNVSEQSLTTIWANEPYQTLQNSYQQIPLCQNCNMRRPV